MDGDSNQGKRRQTNEETMSEAVRRAKNRMAAQKCRKNKGEQMQKLKKKNEELEKENKKLAEEKKELKLQALEYRKSVAMHCTKGCKIPDKLKEFWRKEMAEASSSDSDDSETDTQDDAGVADEMYSSRQRPSDTVGPSQDLQKEVLDNAEHNFEAPIALFSGRLLNAPRVTRGKNNSTSASSPPVSPTEVSVKNVYSSHPNNLSSFLESTGEATSVAQIYNSTTKDVRMQVDTTAAPFNTAKAPTGMMSDTYHRMGKLSDEGPASLDIVQAQDTCPVVQSRPAIRTCHQLPENLPMTDVCVADQMTMEYQTERDTEVAAGNQTLPSSLPYVGAVEGYIYYEELMALIRNNGKTESENDEMQVPGVSSNNDISYSQSQSHSGPTIPVQAMAPALLNIGPDMAPSLQEQIKTRLSSLSSEAVMTVAEIDEANKCRNHSWPNDNINPRPSKHTKAATYQIACNMNNIKPIIASRQVGSQGETATRERQAENGQSLSRPKGNVSSENIQATVLSQKQLSVLMQKQTVRQNSQSDSFTGRHSAVMSLQHGVQHEQQATWSSSTNGPNSQTGNRASQTATQVFLYPKSQPVVDLASQKNISEINVLSTPTVNNYNETVSFSQPEPNKSHIIVHCDLPRTSLRTTIPIASETTHSLASTGPQISRNTQSRQMMQQSLRQNINGAPIHEKSRLAAVTISSGAAGTRPVMVTAPTQQFTSQIYRAPNTETRFIPTVTTSNINVPSGSATQLNTTSWQFQQQITRANSTENGFTPKLATSNNAVVNSARTRLNPTSWQLRPQINGTSTANGHAQDAIANDASYISTQSLYNKSTQPDATCFSLLMSDPPTIASQSFNKAKSPGAKALPFHDLQVSKAASIRNRKGYCPNTEASCNGTYNTDQVFITTSAETSLQPTMNFSDVNFGEHGPAVALQDLLSVTNTPQCILDYSSSECADIDFLSSPQATTEIDQFGNTSDDTVFYTSNNADIAVTDNLNVNIQHSFNHNSTAESQAIQFIDALNDGNDITSLTTANIGIGDNFQSLSNLNVGLQHTSGQTQNNDPLLTNCSDVINHNCSV